MHGIREIKTINRTLADRTADHRAAGFTPGNMTHGDLKAAGALKNDTLFLGMEGIQCAIDVLPPFFNFWQTLNAKRVAAGGVEVGYGEARELFAGGPTPHGALTFIGKEFEGLRAVPVDPVGDKPAYHGEYREVTGDKGTVWHKVLNNDQLPIVYTTPEHAINAAIWHRDAAIEKAFR